MKLGTNATLLSLAIEKSSSLRMAIPVSVADKLGLKNGDRVKWDFGKMSDELIVTVRKSVE